MKTDSYIPYSKNQLTKKGGCDKNTDFEKSRIVCKTNLRITLL